MKSAGWLLVLVALGAYVGCKVPPPKQAEESPLPGEEETSEPEDEEPEDEEPEDEDESSIDEPPPVDEPAAEDSAPPAEEVAEAPPSRPACADIKKAKCKITSGCAWNDVHKCVDE